MPTARPLWGQAANFATATHDWQRRQVVVLPEKPVKQLSLHMLLRGHSGKAWFRDAELRVVRPPAGACLFDGMPVVHAQALPREGFQLRDVAAGSDLVLPGSRRAADDIRDASIWASNVDMAGRQSEKAATFYDVSIGRDSTGDRAVTLVFALPVAGQVAAMAGRSAAEHARRAGPRVSSTPRSSTPAPTAACRAIRWAPWPATDRGIGPGDRSDLPGLQFRIGYNAGTGELYLAYDLGLRRRSRRARARFCRFRFEPSCGFRGALARYYELFPDGLPLPHARAGPVDAVCQDQPGAGLGGFRFQVQGGQRRDRLGRRTRHPHLPLHGADDLVDADAEGHAADARRRHWPRPGGWPTRATRRPRPSSRSGYHDAQGRLAARLLDTPWCNGAVWSMNSMPGIAGEVTDFKNKWNPAIREKLYGPRAPGRSRRRVHRLQRGLRDRRARFPPRSFRRRPNAAGVLARRSIGRPSSAA